MKHRYPFLLILIGILMGLPLGIQAQTPQFPGGVVPALQALPPCTTQSTYLNVQIVPDTITVCRNTSVELNGSSDPNILAWQWSTGQTTDTIIVNQPGDYSVIGYDSLGCPDTAYARVDTFPSLVDILPDMDSVCAGDTLVLDVADGSFVTYNWMDSTALTSTFNVLNAGIYHVEVLDSFGCTINDTVSVSVLSRPTVSAPAAQIVCPGDSVTFDGGTGYNSYSWSSGQSTQMITVSAPGSYNLTVTQSGFSCPSNPIPFILQNHPSPATPVISFNGMMLTSSTASSYQWYYENGLLSGENSESLDPYTYDSGIFGVEVTDANGCIAYGDTTIILQIRQEDIPKGLAPNSSPTQAGVANFDYTRFYIFGIDGFPNNKLTVYNRYGNVVYEAEPYTASNPWDGSNMDGNSLPAGTYFYILDLQDGTEPLSGSILLTR